MLAEMATLSFLADFLRDLFKGVAGDKIKETISPDRAAKAKKTVFALYQALEAVSFLSDQFVLDVKDLTDYLAETDFSEDTYFAKCDALVDTMEDISNTLQSISRDISDLNPQLQIYKPDMVTELTTFGVDRSMAISSVKQGIYQKLGSEITVEAIQAARPQLIEALHAAETNTQHIHEVTENFRAFIASEYSFKESF